MAITPKNLSQQVRRQQVRFYIPAVSTASDATKQWPLFRAPYALTVTAARVIPQADITGADTNSATSVVRNAGSDGSGTTSVASYAWTSGNDGVALDALDLTLSTTAANLDFAAGEVATFERTKVGTGLALPEFCVEVEYEITDNSDKPE